MQVRNFHDDETLPRSVKKTDYVSASQCETKNKSEPFPVFDWRKMLSVNSDPQCENKKKNAQCDFSYSMWKQKRDAQCEFSYSLWNKDKMLSVTSAS